MRLTTQSFTLADDNDIKKKLQKEKYNVVQMQKGLLQILGNKTHNIMKLDSQRRVSR